MFHTCVGNDSESHTPRSLKQETTPVADMTSFKVKEGVVVVVVAPGWIPNCHALLKQGISVLVVMHV